MGEIEANTPLSTKQNDRLAKRGDFGISGAFFEPGSYPETIMSGKGTP